MNTRPIVVPVVLAFGLGMVAGGTAIWLVMRKETARSAAGGDAATMTGHDAAWRVVDTPAGSGGQSAVTRPPGGTPAAQAAAGGNRPSDDLRRILRMDDITARTTALRRFLAGQSPEELVATMRELKRFLQDQEHEDTPAGLMAVLSSWEIAVGHAAAVDPVAVLAAFKTGPGDKDDDFPRGIFRAWAARDLDAARDYLENVVLTDPKADKKQWIGELAREFVKSDPDAAFVWLRGLKSEFAAAEMGDAFQTLSHHASGKAGKLLALHADLPDAPGWAASMCQGWAKSEPDKALEWAAGLPPRLAATAIPVAVQAMAEKDAAQALAAARGMTGEHKAAALAGAAKGLAPEQLPSLVPMVDGLADGTGKATAVEAMLGKWAAKSPEDASAWLARQTPGVSRDAGARSLANGIIDSDPVAAMEWSAAIANGTARQKQLDTMVARWLDKDAPAARQWVKESARLTEDDRARLLERTGR